MNKPDIKISIIFPSYNGEDVILNNLNSLRNLNNANEIEIIITDNDSKDSTKEIIKSFNNLNIQLLELSKTIGEFIFITKQDVDFPNDFFEIILTLYKKIKKDKELIICPAIVFPSKYINYFGAKVHFLGFSYTPNMYQKIPIQKLTFKTLKASGCSMFMKKSTFSKLNGFDPFFFMYHEDTDFSLRAIRNGVLIYTTNETLLHHKKLHMAINNFTYYNIEKNRYIVLYKNIKSIKGFTQRL